VVAERQGQTAAMNMLGFGEKFDAVPFFWSQHYDLTINYVGHAEQWEDAELDGSFASRDFSITYKRASACSQWLLRRAMCKACKPNSGWNPRDGRRRS